MLGLIAGLWAGQVAAADLGGVELLVGTDPTSPPMEMLDSAAGRIVGFDVDVVTAICARIHCEAKFLSADWAGLFPALEEGQYDLLASGISITEERMKTMDFTEPYLTASQAIMVRKSDTIQTLADFVAGRKLSAQSKTSDADLAVAIAGQDNVVTFESFQAAIEALRRKRVDGVVINGLNGPAYEEASDGELVVGIRNLTTDPMGLAFRKGDPLVAAFDEGLAEIMADGTLAALKQKYWGGQ